MQQNISNNTRSARRRKRRQEPLTFTMRRLTFLTKAREGSVLPKHSWSESWDETEWEGEFSGLDPFERVNSAEFVIKPFNGFIMCSQPSTRMKKKNGERTKKKNGEDGKMVRWSGLDTERRACPFILNVDQSWIRQYYFKIKIERKGGLTIEATVCHVSSFYG